MLLPQVLTKHKAPGAGGRGWGSRMCGRGLVLLLLFPRASVYLQPGVLSGVMSGGTVPAFSSFPQVPKLD